MSNLMDIMGKAFLIEKKLLESGGEITSEIAELINVNGSYIAANVDSLAYTLNRLENSAEFFEKKAQELFSLAKSIEQANKTLKQNILEQLELSGENEYKGQTHKFSKQTGNPTCDVFDEALLPEEYKVTVVTQTVEKKKIAADLKIGLPIPGAKLIYKPSLRVRLNRE